MTASDPTEGLFNCVKQVIEACFQSRCGVPSEIIQLLEKNQSKQIPGIQKCWKIVQTFHELTEDTDTSTLLKECQKISFKDESKPRTRSLRVYICGTETNILSISIKEDEDAGGELQKISPIVFYKDFQTVQGQLSLIINYKDKKNELPIKANVSIFVVSPGVNQSIILGHLLDNVKDAGTLQFALTAEKDIELTIEKRNGAIKTRIGKKDATI
ncbi:hypothetical protein RFI_35193 [Reticulomyxa filosa]|uniref:Uncharacterized protein n=1 Tax=Reticulomyxa filosa TaxID=46433 RepID=X6LLK0_RETFI|nr:hypothetical protein RFI_35193 [Reticulomyxa filosa]|eukprot:ETO02241.1 hypothetical protein RFI_35193 [Reticulomyxa filosa]